MEGSHGGMILRHMVTMTHSHKEEKDEYEYAAYVFHLFSLGH